MEHDFLHSSTVSHRNLTTDKYNSVSVIVLLDFVVTAKCVSSCFTFRTTN